MQPFLSSQITGTWATLLLPINADDSIDFSRLREELSILLSSGVNGIYSGGTAGEFYALSEEEYRQVNELMAQMCESVGMPFEIDATSTSAQHCLQRVEIAANLHPAAIQVILPDWYPLSDAEVLLFLNRVAEVAGTLTYSHD